MEQRFMATQPLTASLSVRRKEQSMSHPFQIKQTSNLTQDVAKTRVRDGICSKHRTRQTMTHTMENTMEQSTEQTADQSPEQSPEQSPLQSTTPPPTRQISLSQRPDVAPLLSGNVEFCQAYKQMLDTKWSHQEINTALHEYLHHRGIDLLRGPDVSGLFIGDSEEREAWMDVLKEDWTTDRILAAVTEYLVKHPLPPPSRMGRPNVAMLFDGTPGGYDILLKKHSEAEINDAAALYLFTHPEIEGMAGPSDETSDAEI